MGDLLLKFAENIQQGEEIGAKATLKSISTKPAQKKIASADSEAVKPDIWAHSRGIKRTRYDYRSTRFFDTDANLSSDALATADNKENALDVDQPIPNPKKRTRTAVAAPSRQVTNPSTVLSPKSSNSRTLPHSPSRQPFGSPQKPYLSRPVSPLKPISPCKATSPAKAAALAATTTLASLVSEKQKPGRGTNTRKASKPAAEPRTTNTRSRRGATNVIVAESRTASSSSNYSGISTSTTVVKVNTKAQPGPKASIRKGVGVSAAGKKVAAAKIEAPAAGKRVLRKRP